MYGEIFVLTKMRQLPRCCTQCSYYCNMGTGPGRANDGACTARGGYVSTASIKVSRERLPGCPLVKLVNLSTDQIERERTPDPPAQFPGQTSLFEQEEK